MRNGFSGVRRIASTSFILALFGAADVIPGTNVACADSPPVRMCSDSPSAPACAAVRGDRSEGWAPQSRSEVMVQHGVVSTVQPLAAMAGARILMQGGNAIDAAVATAAALNVTYPANVGIGGDLFAIIYIAKEHKVYQLNASGKAPSGATLAHLHALGYQWNAANWGPGSGMPSGGILTVTVPGSLWGWQEVLDRFGTMTFQKVLQPAIDYAQNGFPITEEIGEGWRLPNALPLQGCCTRLDPDSVNTYYINDAPPAIGTIFRNPGLAHTFRMIQQQGRDVFYKGEIAQAIVAKSDALGGTMTLADLANYQGEWVTPASTTYQHGEFGLYGTTAPSQAWGIMEAMNILEACVPTWYPGQSLAMMRVIVLLLLDAALLPRNQRAVYPPSTASACPITKPAPGLQSHNTAEAISSGLPRRPIGCSFIMSFMVSGSLAIIAATIGVSMAPGHIALMRMPRAAYSRAALLVRPITPCLVAW